MTTSSESTRDNLPGAVRVETPAKADEVERVRLYWNHTYVGSEGTVTEKLPTGCWSVMLDNGVEVWAWPSQRQVVG